MASTSNRRSFMGQTAAIGAGLWLGTQSRARATSFSPLQTLAAACVGVGGKGSSDSTILRSRRYLVGLCDVDERTLTKKGREFPDAAKYTDFREMLDALGSKVDIVTVSTPDHTHAAAAIKAMKMKKHVYCQKPLTWSIYEAARCERLLRKWA